MKSIIAAVAVCICLSLGIVPSAGANQYTKCEMTFSLKGWSFVYKTMKGTGKVTCANGQTATVALESHAGGLTVGKSEIDDGKGTFSSVKDISEIYGSYVVGEAHAGAAKSATASVMTKGEISLAITGKGRGVDVGVTLGAFTIKKP
jgi:hypothetical protein